MDKVLPGDGWPVAVGVAEHESSWLGIYVGLNEARKAKEPKSIERPRIEVLSAFSTPFMNP